MKQKKMIAIVFALILTLSLAGCAKPSGAGSSEPTQPSSSANPPAGEELPPAITAQGAVDAAPAPEEEADGTMSFGELRLRVENGAFQFSTDKGVSWSSDWEGGLPDGYSYTIEGDTLEVNTDDGCATMTK